MKTLLILGVSLAGVLLFLLATASANTSLFAEHYSLLLGLNAVLAVALLGLVGYQLASLRRRLKGRVFGSRLTLRFLILFATMAVVPGVLVYTVSVQFLTKSIESWFDVSVDSALEGGIKLGQAAVDQMLAELNTKARAMAIELADQSDSQQVVALNRLRQQAGVEDAVVVAANGRLVASANDNLSQLVPALPSSIQLRQARTNRGLTSIDSLPGKPLGLRVVVPIAGSTISDETRYLQLRHPVPETLAKSAEAVEVAYGDYRKVALLRQGLKRNYIATLTLALLIALFSAVALAFILSDRISAPLSDLAQATQDVARGDFSRRMPITSRDELGVLLASFNSMTRQLDEARGVVESNRVQLETAKARLENILANLSAGVLVFDRELRLSIFNRGAAAILGANLAALSGKPPEEWRGFESFANPVREAFSSHGEKSWQIELVLAGTGKTLLARGTPLPSGYVLVFDDVTQLIQAQRATAWAEVARRLAHEIKNPLTPIQLSAERLEMKFAVKLGPEDGEILRRGTRTIVNQVAALKAMVDDFRDYARLPAPVLTRLDLNALVAEVLTMYEMSTVPIVRRLAPELPPVYADSSQMRQVLHNLVQNAQDALGATGGADASIEVRTEQDGDRIRLAVSDNGGGFPEELMSRIFEPYVTTKPRGTGLGLAIVKKIVDEHHGEIAIENGPSRGASVSILLPANHDATSARAA
jgi:nitrogen fixation/metabolism regulation signal transduction histidine kinase